MCYDSEAILANLPGGPEGLRAVAAAEDSLARLDERLRGSQIAAGWIARSHFYEALGTVKLAGELVHLDDLVLHDAEIDRTCPSEALALGHAALRARRRIAAERPGHWLKHGIKALRHADRVELATANPAPPAPDDDADQEAPALSGAVVEDDPLAREMAALDAAIARSSRLLREGPDGYDRIAVAFLYDEDRDEAGGLAEWRAVADGAGALPATLAAAVAYEAWRDIAPLQTDAWLGSLLVADLLRERGKAAAHLPCLDVGLVETPRERRRHRERGARILAALDAIAAAARAGLAEFDRLAAARAVLARRLDGRRCNSKLPALLDLVISSPLVTAPMAARALHVTPQAAQKLIAQLGLRELTGRHRFRAWGV